MSFREGELEALVEMAAHLKENATDVNDALNEVENYLQILKNLAVEVGEISYELRHEKTCLWGFQLCPTQIGLYNHRKWLEALNFGF